MVSPHHCFLPAYGMQIFWYAGRADQFAHIFPPLFLIVVCGMCYHLPVWLRGMQNALAYGLYWQLNGLSLVLITAEFIGGVMTEICSTSTMTSLKGSSTAEFGSKNKFGTDSKSATTSSATAAALSALSKPSKTCPDFKDDENQSACCRSRITQGAFFCCTQEHRAQIEWEEHKEAWRQFFQKINTAKKIPKQTGTIRKERNHVSELVIGSIIVAILMCFLMSFLCKRLSFCPMYQPKLFDPIGGRSSSRYPSGYTPYHHPPAHPNSRYRRAPMPSTPSCATSGVAAALSADLLSSSSPTNGASQEGTGYTSGMLQANKPPTLYEAPPTYEFATSSYHSCSQSSGHPTSRHDGNQANCPVVVANPQQRLHDWDCLLENEVNDLRQASNTHHQPDT